MTRFAEALGLTALWVMAAVGSTDAGDVVGSFPDECLMVGRLDVHGFRAVPVVRNILDNQLGQAAAFIEQIRTWTGVDLNTATTLWLGVAKKDHGVFVLEGQFDVEEIKGAMLNIDAAQIVPKEFVPIAALLPDEKKPGTYNLGAVLDDRTIVLGQPEVAEHFIDAYTKVAATGLGKGKLDRVQGLRSSQALFHGFILGLEPQELQKNPWLNYLTHGEFTADVDGDLAVCLSVGVRNPDMVEPLQKILQGLVSVFSKMDEPHRKGDRIQKMLVDNATISAEGSILVLRSKLKEQFINELVAVKLNDAGQ